MGFGTGTKTATRDTAPVARAYVPGSDNEVLNPPVGPRSLTKPHDERKTVLDGEKVCGTVVRLRLCGAERKLRP